MTRTSRNVTVGLIVTVGLAGIGWTASAEPAQSSTVILQDQDAAQVRLKTQIALEDDEQLRRCWTGIRSSSTRSLRRIRRTPPVSGSGRSFTRRSSMRTTASNSATRQFSFTTGRPHGASRRAAVDRCGVHGAGRPVPVPTAGAGCQLCGFAGGAERRLRARRPIARTTALVRDAHRARHRLGNRGRAGRARLARDRWVQRELPAVHRWDRGRPVAADTAGVRTDERPGVGIHRRCSSWSTTPSSSLDHREV